MSDKSSPAKQPTKEPSNHKKALQKSLQKKCIATARRTMQAEAAAIRSASLRLSDSLPAAVDLILNHAG